MFSVLVFTYIAMSAIASTASGANLRATCSVRSSSVYCLSNAFCGSVRMRTKSSRVKGSSSTWIGKRPWSSGMRSEGFAMWKAPAAMNRTWSVRPGPYLVVTAAPSPIGSRSRCTPSAETSGTRRDLLAAGRRVGLVGPPRPEEAEEPLLGELVAPLLHARHHLGLDHVHRQLGEVADHRFHVASHVADLGVLGGLDLQEGRLGELREPAGHLGLPDAGRADHDDVLRRHLVAQVGRQVLPPPAVAQRDRYGALGPLLSDDVAVELGDDLCRGEGQVLIHRTSTLMWSLVKTQIEAATRIASVTMPLASRSECATSARAAASAYAPPEPMPMRPSSGSITSPLPEMMNECSRSATARSASSRRRTRSVRQALAPSTAARSRLPRCSSSRLSKREKRVNASAAVPAKPARMRSW